MNRDPAGVEPRGGPARSLRPWLAFGLLGALLVAVGSVKTRTEGVWLDLGGQRILAEIADTTERRARGLMYRESLAADRGMLFVFPQPRRLAFWMLNTPIDLDIGFFDERGRLLEVRSMRAHDTRRVLSSHPARFALEVNAGWFARNGIEPGVRLNGHEALQAR